MSPIATLTASAKERLETKQTTTLSIILPTRNEKENLELLLPQLEIEMAELGMEYEVIVVDGASTDGTLEAAQRLGAIAFQQKGLGFGTALKQGFQAATGEHIVTLDADLSHDPKVIKQLWEARHGAEVVVASRYCQGGDAQASMTRRALSRILNWVFESGFHVGVTDLSSGFRLYRAEVIKDLQFEATTYDAQEEILIRIHRAGWRITEIPFTYLPRIYGNSKARIVQMGMRLAGTYFRMRRLESKVSDRKLAA